MRIGKTWDVHKKKGELECAPSWSLDTETLAKRPSHYSISYPKRIERVRILSKKCYALLNAICGNTREAYEFFSRIAATSLQRRYVRSPRFNPGTVLIHERPNTTNEIRDRDLVEGGFIN
jgi:hypothetical protein